MTSVDDPDPSFTAQGRSGPRDAVRTAARPPTRRGGTGTERRSRLRADERETPATLAPCDVRAGRTPLSKWGPPAATGRQAGRSPRCRLVDGIGPREWALVRLALGSDHEHRSKERLDGEE